MKNIIANSVETSGAGLWEMGGWTGKERYEDLSVTGKRGYNMLCTGVKMKFGSLNNFIEFVNK